MAPSSEAPLPAPPPSPTRGVLSSVGKRMRFRNPRYLLCPSIKMRRVKSPKGGSQRRCAAAKRLLVVPEADGYDPPRQKIRYKLDDAVARHAKREAHLQPVLLPLTLGTQDDAMRHILTMERRVLQSNKTLKQQSVTPILADCEDASEEDEPGRCTRRVPGARQGGRKWTIQSCRWGRMTLTPGEMAAMYGVAPSVANVYTLYELSLFYAIDTRIPVGLVMEEQLQHLKLVPCSPGSSYVHSCPTLLRAPPLDSPVRDMYRTVRTLALERAPQTEKNFKSFQRYHAHLYGPNTDTVLQGWHFPCAHPGKCTVQNCCCIRSFNFCTRLCCNGLASSNAFKGCSCTAGCRQTNSCTCRRSNRECDPALCRCDGCANNELQQAERPSLRVAESTIANCGLGAFAVNALRKGELVGEYLGELISEAECARRFPVQRSILGHNHMAQVTTDVVIDASRLGNDLRYLNHSSEPNCEQRSVFVWTRWRLAIYTLRDIQPGEELFFDYGPSFFPRPQSVNPIPSIKYIVSYEGIHPPQPSSNGRSRQSGARQQRDRSSGDGGTDNHDDEEEGNASGLEEATDDEGHSSSASEGESSTSTTTSSGGSEKTGSIVAVFAAPGEYWLGQALAHRKGQVLLQWLDHAGHGRYTFLPTSDWVRAETILVEGVPMLPEGQGAWVVEEKTRLWLERTAQVLKTGKRGKVVPTEGEAALAATPAAPEPDREEKAAEVHSPQEGQEDDMDAAQGHTDLNRLRQRSAGE